MYKEKYNILIVEDEFINSQFVEQVLTMLGHNIIGNVKNANSAIAISKTNNIDLIFMDINLEGNIDGILCSKMINKDKTIPIIYITAFKDSKTLEDVINTNMYGYLIKPFDEKDIEATLMVAIRQIKTQRNNIVDIAKIINLGNNYKYDQNTKTFTIKEIPISLTKKELAILDILCDNINLNISYEVLENYIWGDREITISTIRDTVLRLRKKAPLLNIDNLSGFGYCLKSA